MEYTKEELDKLVDELLMKDAIYIARRLSRVLVMTPSLLCQWDLCHACTQKETCIHRCHAEDYNK